MISDLHCDMRYNPECLDGRIVFIRLIIETYKLG